MTKIWKYHFEEAGKELAQKTFIFSTMLIKACTVIFVEINFYFRVIYLLKNCHWLHFSIEESYVYEFIRL